MDGGWIDRGNGARASRRRRIPVVSLFTVCGSHHRIPRALFRSDDGSSAARPLLVARARRLPRASSRRRGRRRAPPRARPDPPRARRVDGERREARRESARRRDASSVS
eukprot:31367-Pelagococcus_subviridis.AAC.3